MLAQLVVNSGVMPCAVLQFRFLSTKPVLNDRIERKVTAGRNVNGASSICRTSSLPTK